MVGVGRKGCPVGCSGAQELRRGEDYNSTQAQACSFCVAAKCSCKAMRARSGGGKQPRVTLHNIPAHWFFSVGNALLPSTLKGEESQIAQPQVKYLPPLPPSGKSVLKARDHADRVPRTDFIVQLGEQQV